MANRAAKVIDQELQIKDVRKQLGDQLGSLDFRMDSKLSLIAEYQEFFKRRGEVEYEYARALERLCEKFERNTKQRNLKNELRSTFNLWSTLLAETRKTSRERAWIAESLATEMAARLEVMAKDVQTLTKKCKDMCVEIQDQLLKELRDLSEQTKVYQHSCHNTSETGLKAAKSKEKMDSIKGAAARRKKAEEKYKERQKQFKIQKHLLLKNRNDYLLGIARCNALSGHYFSADIKELIENMDFDYHDAFMRMSKAYRDVEKDACEALMASGDTLVEQSKSLNLENDLNYFMSEYSAPFNTPTNFQFTPFDGDDVQCFKVNTEDIFRRWHKTMADLKEEIQTLKIQREEDMKTILHMKYVNLKRYQVTTVDDAYAVIEDNGDTLTLESSRDRGTASLERGLALSTRGAQAITLSQKGKKDTMVFTLQIVQRRILREDRLAVASAQLEILEKAFSEQKVPPVSVAVDAHGRALPGEVPPLFGGDIIKYIMATGSEVPLIVESCVRAIEKHGMDMEGLFRVPGPAALLDELRVAFEEGRDPLADTSYNKLDVAGVASTLKAYFRELSTPLFPTDRYQEFISCTRQDDAQSKIDMLSVTVRSLPPQIISVMRFLFRFLHRVSLHAADNKMGSANLALVFGPTLTRAPDSLDPRQLHNDVPSVNLLIQMCIDKHDYIFGEEKEEEPEASTATPVPDEDNDAQKTPLLSTSPPAEPPNAPPTVPPIAPPTDSLTTSPEHLLDDEDVCELPPPPPRPPKAEDEVELPTDSEPPPPRPPKPEAMSPPPPPPSIEEPPVKERPSPPDPHVIAGAVLERAARGGSEEEVKEGSVGCEGSHGLESSTSSGLDMSSLDATMQEIEESLQELGGASGDVAVPAADLTPVAEVPATPNELDEDEDDDSDSEDEGDGLRIGARALYDYVARSDKELSFSRGDSLQVITKTPDNNWWDGFFGGRRGFIPVAYVEVTELKPSPSPVTPQPATPVGQGPGLFVPAPPQRKSSIPVTDGEPSGTKVSEPPQEVAISEEPSSEGPTPEPAVEEPVTSPRIIAEPPAASAFLEVQSQVSAPAKDTEAEPCSETSEDDKMTDLPSSRSRGSSTVKSLTKQFQEPEATGPKVLVEPHHSHRRQMSDQKPATSGDGSDTQVHPRSGSDTQVHPRSASGNSKVSMLSSTFESKAASAAPPPPLKPKPAPLSSSAMPGDVFPLMQHGTSLGVSPLQKAAHQSLQGGKPAVASKKPAVAAAAKAAQKPAKTSLKGKKKDGKEKEKGGKPAPNPKPGFGASPAELQAELQARVKRKQSDPLK